MSAKKKTTSKRSRWPMLIFGLSVVAAIVALLLCTMSLWRAYPMQGQVQILTIQKGDTYSGWIDKQSQNQNVYFPLVLKLYQKFFIDSSLKAGVYEITQGTSVAQVLQMLSNAENAQMNRILVIEGTTFKQLLDTLRQDPLVRKEVSDLPYPELLKALDIPYTHPEGLFAPDTYFFAKGESDKKILKDLYQRQMKNLAAAWDNRDDSVPYTDQYQALIMASIVEKETNVDAELTQVSGVFARRLKIGMRLQTDPTVIYGMGERYQGNITRQDLRTPTPYNTYTIHGLPPTPIALPSQKAIEATLHPDRSENLYFVATGTGGHKFSVTLQQHNQAVKEYLTVLRANKE